MFNFISDTLVKPAENHYHDLITLERENYKEKVWLNLEIIGDGAEAESVKRAIQISIEDVFFTEPQKEGYERFEETLKEINLLLKNLRNKNQEGNFCQINAILAIQEDTNLHLTQTGEAEAYLIRGNKLNLISDGLSSRKTEESDVFMNIASGEITFNDKLVFTSRRLLKQVSEQQLAVIFNKNIPEALLELNTLLKDATPLSITAILLKRSVFATGEDSFQHAQILANEPLQKLKIHFDRFVYFVAKKMGKDPNQMEKFSIIAGIAGIIVILSLGVTLLFSSNIDKETYALYNKTIINASEEIKKAEKLALMDDKGSANEILNLIETNVVKILNDGYFRVESAQILDKIKELRDEVNDIQRIRNPKILADLSTKRSDVNLLGIVNLNNLLYTYEYNALYETILDKVENPLTISATETINDAISMPEKDLIIFKTNSNKIIEFNNGQFSMGETTDTMWKKATAMAVYSKYLYLLSPEDNQIWKYERRKAGYEKAAKYNLDGDLSKALDISIDGSVYVLSEGGEIIKLYRGNKQKFDIQNSPAEDLANTTKLFTLPDQNNLYLLNPQKNSILIIKKLTNGQGEYKRQIILEGTGPINDIYVNQDEQKLYAVDKNHIYEIGL